MKQDRGDYMSKKRYMNRLIYVIVILLLSTICVGCNNSNNKKQDMTISWVYNSNYLLGGLDDSIVQ